jgi:hypothetical protein
MVLVIRTRHLVSNLSNLCQNVCSQGTHILVVVIPRRKMKLFLQTSHICHEAYKVGLAQKHLCYFHPMINLEPPYTMEELIYQSFAHLYHNNLSKLFLHIDVSLVHCTNNVRMFQPESHGQRLLACKIIQCRFLTARLLEA